MKCDFCSSPEVVARYHALPFIAEHFSGPGLIQESVGDWAACSTCEALIDADRWGELTDRAVTSFYKRYPNMAFLVDAKDLREELSQTYAKMRTMDFYKIGKV